MDFSAMLQRFLNTKCRESRLLEGLVAGETSMRENGVPRL
jgi:hypothetical protein